MNSSDTDGAMRFISITPFLLTACVVAACACARAKVVNGNCAAMAAVPSHRSDCLRSMNMLLMI